MIRFGELLPVRALEPATDAAGRSSDTISTKHMTGHLGILVHITQGAANTVTLTPMQCTDVAAGTNKVLSENCQIWSNLDQAASDTWVARTAAKNYTTDAGVKHKGIYFEIDLATLDIANSYDCIYITTGASNVGNITQAWFIPGGLRAGGVAAPTMITD